MACLLCERCQYSCKDRRCAAVVELYRIYEFERQKEREKIVQRIRRLLDIPDYFVSGELEQLGESVLYTMPDLRHILDSEVKIAYVLSYEEKKDKKRRIFAETKKVTGTMTAFLPYDVIITFYQPNIMDFTLNQLKILMWHELKHINITTTGQVTIVPHETEDWEIVLKQCGLDWQQNNDVPDIFEINRKGCDM